MKRSVIILLAFMFMISCSQADNKSEEKQAVNKTEEKKTVQETAKDDCSGVHWTYEGETGPDHWKDLCSGFAACGGERQSPIDIQTANVVSDDQLAKPELHYASTPVHIVNNGHTVQFNVSGDNTAKLDGKDYALLQFHYHHLSEHTIDGKHFPLEVHFVHKHSDNDFAVIGVMFVEGKENDLLKKYLDKFPKEKGEFKADEQIDLADLMPSDLTYYRYDGSLTTPPCSEVVNWYVLKTPVEASKEQIEKFAEILHNNYRPVQPLNGRQVKFFKQ